MPFIPLLIVAKTMVIMTVTQLAMLTMLNRVVMEMYFMNSKS